MDASAPRFGTTSALAAGFAAGFAPKPRFRLEPGHAEPGDAGAATSRHPASAGARSAARAALPEAATTPAVAMLAAMTLTAATPAAIRQNVRRHRRTHRAR
ncbi:hypothetical protein, partial [Burkholderia oklahomensis]|uniref:hypothetical protein n=1 Tax=Burkholderia oklahomensis TaxID=342113 RepID=UPI001E50452C